MPSRRLPCAAAAGRPPRRRWRRPSAAASPRTQRRAPPPAGQIYLQTVSTTGISAGHQIAASFEVSPFESRGWYRCWSGYHCRVITGRALRAARQLPSGCDGTHECMLRSDRHPSLSMSPCMSTAACDARPRVEPHCTPDPDTGTGMVRTTGAARGAHQRRDGVRLVGADQRRDDLTLAAEHGLDDGRVQEWLRRCASGHGKQSVTRNRSSLGYLGRAP